MPNAALFRPGTHINFEAFQGGLQVGTLAYWSGWPEGVQDYSQAPVKAPIAPARWFKGLPDKLEGALCSSECDLTM